MKYVSPFFKIHFSIWLLLLSTVFNIVAAQTDSIPDYQPKYNHAKKPYTYRTKVTILFFGLGVMSTGNHSGNLNISVPYKTVDINNATTSHVFHGTSDHLFSTQSPEILFGFDLSRPSFAFNFSIGTNLFYKGSFCSIEHGINFYLGQHGKTLHEKTKNCNWIIRPSLNMNFFSFSTGSIGSISNTNTTIYILNTEAKPTYTYTTKSGHSTYTHTANADNLTITYKQNQIGIEPKIALCSNPYKKKFSIQIFASYFIPIYESSGLVLTQKSNDPKRSELLSTSSENKLKHHSEINATYNNRTFTTIPFHANHMYIGVVLGLTF